MYRSCSGFDENKKSTFLRTAFKDCRVMVASDETQYSIIGRQVMLTGLFYASSFLMYSRPPHVIRQVRE